MIQRKQTIWLLLAIASYIGSIYLPYATSSFTAPTITAVQTTAVNTTTTMVGILLLVLNIVCAGFAIFLFKKRSLQLLLCWAGIALSLGCAAYEFIIGNDMANNKALTFGFALPLVAVVLFFAAWRGIRADEALLKSVDRLRD